MNEPELDLERAIRQPTSEPVEEKDINISVHMLGLTVYLFRLFLCHDGAWTFSLLWFSSSWGDFTLFYAAVTDCTIEAYITWFWGRFDRMERALSFGAGIMTYGE